MGIVRRTVLASGVGAALVLAACSGGGSDGTDAGSGDPSDSIASTATSGESQAAPSPAAEAEDVVRSFYEDLAADELDDACAWWTPGYARTYVARWNDGEFGTPATSCPELLAQVRQVVAISGQPGEQLEVVMVSGELVDDATARVDVSLASAPGSVDTYRLSLTDAGWRISGDEAGELAATQEPGEE